MHIVLTIDISKAVKRAIADTLAVVRGITGLDAENKRQPMEFPACRIKWSEEPVEEVEFDTEALSKLAEDGFTDGDGTGQAFSPDAPDPAPLPETLTITKENTDATPPDAETVAAARTALVQAPEPEPAEPAAKSAVTLDQVRKHFIDISQEYPAAKHKISDILIAAGVRNLSALPEDQYETAMAELDTWVEAQKG